MRSAVVSPHHNYQLYHVSPSRNNESINRRGLNLRYANPNNVLPGVWLVSASKVDWAVGHTLKRHHTRKVDIYRVRVQRRHLVRFRRGIWRHVVSVDPLRITYLSRSVAAGAQFGDVRYSWPLSAFTYCCEICGAQVDDAPICYDCLVKDASDPILQSLVSDDYLSALHYIGVQ